MSSITPAAPRHVRHELETIGRCSAPGDLHQLPWGRRVDDCIRISGPRGRPREPREPVFFTQLGSHCSGVARGSGFSRRRLASTNQGTGLGVGRIPRWATCLRGHEPSVGIRPLTRKDYVLAQNRWPAIPFKSSLRLRRGATRGRWLAEQRKNGLVFSEWRGGGIPRGLAGPWVHRS